jgi:para-aminobenzoate synthetase/4-amino-4-deoxychorismate lyase
VEVGSPDAEVGISSMPAGDRPTTGWRLIPRVVAGGWGAHKWRDRRLLVKVEPAPSTWGPDCDALIVDTDASVLETGRGNVFVVHDNEVVTPALDGRILPGTTRAKVIALLERSGVEVRSSGVSVTELASAREVFVSNSIDRIRPVVCCDRVGRWPVGPLTRWLRSGVLDHDSMIERPAARRSAVGERSRVVLVDNYDSFVYNLDQYLGELGIATTVIRNDATTVARLAREVDSGSVDGIIISPGPGRPENAGISNELVRTLGPQLPILGVCLGHQCIAQVFGARVVRAATAVHGKSSLVYHDGAGVFTGLAGPLTAGRYHSLVVEPNSIPGVLEVTARTGDGVVMGLRHRSYPVEGVQFHPESILTRDGHHILANFLTRCAATPRVFA